MRIRHKKTFNESIEEFAQAVRQIGAVLVEAIRSDWQRIRRIVKK